MAISNNNTHELPHDLLAEKALVGCLIIDGSAFDEISNLQTEPGHFYDPRYGRVFDVIRDLSLANRAIDYVTVCNKLKDQGRLEEIGGESFVSALTEDQASSANVYEYAKITKDKYSIREIIKTAMRVVQAGQNFTGNAEDFIQDVESKFFKLTNDAKTGGMVKLNTTLKQNLKELEDTSRVMGEISGLSTGYPKLDELLLGMQPGQLIVLAARPAMGKTSLALNVAQCLSYLGFCWVRACCSFSCSKRSLLQKQ